MRPKAANARSAYSMQLKDTCEGLGSYAVSGRTLHHKHATDEHQAKVNVL
jgi:hypothetical protein